MVESLGSLRPFPPPPPPPEGPQLPAAPIGARWVAGLGAFLLAAAAATFVAVRWDDIPEEAKLAALVGLTGGCVAAHHWLRRSLPVTAGALFHLGVLLVPIDAAAIGLQAGWAWPEMLLAQGLTATVVFGVAAQIEGSVTLRAAAWGGVVALAAGIGAMSALPAGCVLAATAFIAVLGRRWTGRLDADLDLAAIGWAMLAGLAIPLAGAEQLGWPAAGVLVDLGLAGDPPRPLAMVTGLVAALTLGVVARRRTSSAVALGGVACGLVGLTTSWVSVEPPARVSLAALAAPCLVAEVAAALWRSDHLWSRPTEILAGVADGIAGLLTIVLGGVVLLAPVGPEPEPIAGLGAGLLAITWLVAVVRRPAARDWARWSWTRVAAAVAASGAVVLTTGSPTAAAVAMTAAGAAALLGPAAGTWSGPPTGWVMAAGLLAWAPVAAYDIPALAGPLGLIGALVLAQTAVRTLSAGRRHDDRSGPAHPWPATTARSAAGRAAGWSTMLTLTALFPVIAAALVVAARAPLAAAAGSCGAAWLLAAVLDRAGIPTAPTAAEPAGPAAAATDPAVPLALIARVAGLMPLAAAPALEPREAALLGVMVMTLALVDAVRLDRPHLAVGAGIGGPVAVVGLAVASGWSVGQAGLGVTLSGVAWLGVGGTLPGRWPRPAATCAAIAAAAGLGLSASDPAYLATDLLVLGTGLAALGAGIGRAGLVATGLVVATSGLWGHLALAEVAAPEPYLAPVSALLVAAGVYGSRHHASSSWVAYAPAAGLSGAAALLERLSGGPAWHAVVAGGVGLLAVAAGAGWRLAGALMVGTALVVATAIHETLGVTASLPTWVWLAIGGVVLLASGVAMERRGTGPYETGRRLLDLVRERFV